MQFTFFPNQYDKGTETTADLTWDDFVSLMTTHKRTPEKEGGGFSPASFKPGMCGCGSDKCPGIAGHAISDNVLAVHALLFDLDKSEEGGQLTQPEALRHIKHLKDMGIKAIVSSTHSHAPPEKSTWRLAVALSRPITRSEFKPVWKAALKHLGIPSGIKTDNPARFWNRPSCPEDVKPQSIVFSGTPLDVDRLLEGIVIEETAPVDKADHTYPEASKGLLAAARAALKDHSPSISGSGGTLQAYQAAAIVTNDYALDGTEAYHLLVEWNASCQPPWETNELGKFLNDADRYATGEYGDKRDTYEFLEGLEGPEPFSEVAVPGSFKEKVLDAAKDYMEALGAKDESTELVPFFLSAQDLIDSTFDPTPWLITGMLTKDALAALATDPKAGKTWAATEMVIAVASGTKAFGEFEVEQGRCAYFYAEDQGAAVQNRIKSLCSTRDGKIPADLYLQPRGRDLDIGSDLSMAMLIASCRALGPLKLLVLDPLRDLHSSAEDSSDEMSLVMRRLRTLGRVLNCAVMFVHHASKGSADTAQRRPGQRMRGSGAIHGALDCGMYMSNTGTDMEEGHISNRVDVEVKGAKGVGSMNLLLKITDDEVSDTAIAASWTVSYGAPTQTDDNVTEVLKAVGSAEARLEGPVTTRDIHKAIGGPSAAAKNSVANAEKAGYLEKQFIGEVASGWALTVQGKGLFAQIVGV